MESGSLAAPCHQVLMGVTRGGALPLFWRPSPRGALKPRLILRTPNVAVSGCNSTIGRRELLEHLRCRRAAPGCRRNRRRQSIGTGAHRLEPFRPSRFLYSITSSARPRSDGGTV